MGQGKHTPKIFGTESLLGWLAYAHEPELSINNRNTLKTCKAPIWKKLDFFVWLCTPYSALADYAAISELLYKY